MTPAPDWWTERDEIEAREWDSYAVAARTLGAFDYANRCAIRADALRRHGDHWHLDFLGDPTP